MEEVENKSDRTNSLRHYDHPYFFNPKVKKIKKKLFLVKALMLTVERQFEISKLNFYIVRFFFFFYFEKEK